MYGVYLHIPFCKGKCLYCDFYSINYNKDKVCSFLEAIKKEIILRTKKLNTSQICVDTIYFGGGTPSILRVDQIKKILDTLNDVFSIPPQKEITIEVNPSNVSDEMFTQYRRVGINRVVIGVQSFDDEELKMLGRNHSVKDSEAAVKLAKLSGFKKIGFDLIYGLPGQTIEKWEKSLDRTIKLFPSHISTYSLTWNKNTVIGRMIEDNILSTPDDDIVADMFMLADKKLTDAGYEHYEISNFALPGHRCRHNDRYWKCKNYFGFGPSAHSFINKKRSKNLSDINMYNYLLLKNILPIEYEEEITWEKQLIEKISLGLRTNDGVPFGYVSQNMDFIQFVISKGLASINHDRLTLTPRGFLLADEIALSLII